MKNIDIIRLWKDEAYRQSFSPRELAQLPENPAGLIELTDMDLGYAVGGGNSSEDAQACETPGPSNVCFTYACTSRPGPWGCAG